MDDHSCSRGCTNTDPDGGCKASIAIPCPLGNWAESEPYETTAGICHACRVDLDDCYCGEE